MKSKNKLLSLITRLVEYSKLDVVEHIALATQDYKLEQLSDEQLIMELENYLNTLELDNSIPHSESIDDIIQGGLNLNIEEDGE